MMAKPKKAAKRAHEGEGSSQQPPYEQPPQILRGKTKPGVESWKKMRNTG
ncbi:unnamed protein product [Linum tenue]|uniref:Uncharacterized protein n=1 Tax=Linum tenue TaxID=586396 RepID=A0AAV0LF28_9ROSI|nr:unnamed protein product [Linum tenue]